MRGVLLVDAYLGGSGVLTGSARLAMEAQMRIGAEQQQEEVALRRRVLESQRAVTVVKRSRDQLLGHRGAVQERVGRVAVKLGIWAHRCANQRPVRRSWNTTRSAPPSVITSQ